MTDNDFLASVLDDGHWHSHAEILNRSLIQRGCGLTVHSRASDLRKRGMVVEVELRRRDGRTLSFYRLGGRLDEATTTQAGPPRFDRDYPSPGLVASSSAPSSNPVDSAAVAGADVHDHGRDGVGVLQLFEVGDAA